jgi:glutathione S-transferase
MFSFKDSIDITNSHFPCLRVIHLLSCYTYTCYLEGGMTLYLKAGPDGSSVGDCPFAHFVRMVLEEKGLDYELRPCGSNDAKPAWLIEHYGGSMPALRHRQECYIESDVIAQYLDFFFQEPPLSAPNKKIMKQAENAIEGIFPTIAKYLKHSSDDEVEELSLKDILLNKLTALESHLSNESRTGPYLVGNGEQLTLLDCSLAPKLYHLKVGMDAFKKDKAKVDISVHFPHVHKYMDAIFARPSFLKTVYPEETVIWGWENARNKQ